MRTFLWSKYLTYYESHRARGGEGVHHLRSTERMAKESGYGEAGDASQSLSKCPPFFVMTSSLKL